MLDKLDRFFGRRRTQKNGRPMRFFDETRLEVLLGELADAPEDERYLLQVGFYEKLLDCDLLMPVPVGTNVDKGLPILALENSQGEKAMPVFTGEKTFALWADGTLESVPLAFTTLCRYAVESAVDVLLLNLNGPYGCEISSYDFHYLADGLLPPPPSGKAGGEMVIEKNTPMRLAECPGLSDMLMERLGYVFASHGELVSRAYLFNVGFNEGPLQPALGIRMPEGSEARWDRELWPDLQAVLHEMLERRSVVNVFLLNQAGSMEKHVRELTAPIYGR